MKIAVAGIGYVGLSNAILLAQNHQVVAVDVVPEKIDMINERRSPLSDPEIEYYLANHSLNLTATSNWAAAYQDAELVIIATPTNYDSEKNFFDTSLVESVIEQVLEINPQAYMIIKSTIPVGYTAGVCEKYGTQRILFSPEFLREGRALYDKQMRDLHDMPDAAEYMPGIKAAYGDWISDINEKTAEVMAMIQMYK